MNTLIKANSTRPPWMNGIRLAGLLALMAGAAPAGAATVLTAVPWLGSESNPHTVYSGGTIVLQASASVDGLGEPVPLVSGNWDPGDGSGPHTIDLSNSRVLELTHTYFGADNQPFTATVTVNDGSQTYTDTFKVQIQPKTLDVETNMAIAKALWYEHKRMILVGGAPTSGYWPDDNAVASTASTVQAFEVNGHRETGNPLIDPYADDVARGLRYLQANLSRINMVSFTGIPPVAPAVSYTHPANVWSADSDQISPNLWITRGTGGALYNMQSGAIAWQNGSCAAPTSGTFPDMSTLVQALYRQGSGVSVNLPGNTLCLIDLTTSMGYDLEFVSWNSGGDGGFSYNRANYINSLVSTPDCQGHAGTPADPCPDMNGNGYGLTGFAGWDQTYIDGQVIDALVASGTPNALATTGTEAGRAYKDIAQDILDSYSWGQDDDASLGGAGTGGWVYTYNDHSGIDGSSSGWWGIGFHAANTVWGLTAPQWVLDRNLTLGVGRIQHMDAPYNNPNDGTTYTPGDGNYGGCSYRQDGGDGDNNDARTANCLIMLSADGIGKTDQRFQAGEDYLTRSWMCAAGGTCNYYLYGDVHGNMYAAYALTKAMRLAKDAGGNSAPITLLGGTIDWYHADPNPGAPSSLENGLARYLVGTQNSDGSWGSNGWVSGTTSTAWGTLILAPALFEQGPVAACSVDSSIVCQSGQISPCNPTGTNLYANANFDGSQSQPGDNPIASNGYDWDFKDGATANGVTATHSFTTVGTFPVSLKVTDTKNHSSTVTCPVKVTDQALPPVANAGGPYSICPGVGPVILDGSGSFGRGSTIVAYDWDYTSPVNFTPVDASGVTTDQSAYFTAQPPGTYNVGLRVTDNSPTPYQVTSFTTVTVKPYAQCAANFVPSKARVVSRKRISTFIDEVTFDFALTNQGPGNASQIETDLINYPAQVAVIDGESAFPNLVSGATATGDTVKIRVDRRTPISSLTFEVDYNNGVFQTTTITVNF